MKSFLRAAAAAVLVLSAGIAAAAPDAPAAPADDAPSGAAMSENERAGLPDLQAINRPAAEASSKVDINVPRTPSFHTVSPNGTEVTEYRDRGKPVEIDVHSNFGTHYSMSASPDTSPAVRDNGRASTRLPSINLHY